MTRTVTAAARAACTITVGIYLRISLDLQGIGAGIERQREDGDAFTARRGWVGEYYVDNSVSAYSRRTKRPEFERLLADLTSGKIQGIVVYDIDRLARQPRDIERLLDLYETKPSLVFGTCQGDLDLATSDGRFMLRMLVNVANKSSADTARRVARSHLQRAQQGITSGGSRPFGWAADKLALDPVEAPLLRQAVDDVIAGLSLTGIVAQWDAADIRTANGNRWLRTQSLRGLLLSPRMAGYRVHREGIALGTDGKPAMGHHEPMVSIEKWETMCAVLTDPDRTKHAHPGGRKYLLAGLLKCGKCSEPMYGNALTRSDSFFYACRVGCNSNSISGPKLDVIIAELFRRHIALIGQQIQPEAAWSGEAELTNVVGRIDSLMSKFADLTLDGEFVFPAVAKLKVKKSQLEQEQLEWRRQNGSLAIDVDDKEWDCLTTEEQRVELERELLAVAIQPARIRRFDAERIEPVWRRTGAATPATA